MNAGLHKLTAGDGYTYLTRQVAVMDSTERGASSMNDYYSMKGEAPGRWGGRGLAALTGLAHGDVVTEEQMKSLFGLGQHPNAVAITERVVAEEIAKGAKPKDAVRAAASAVRLGNPFRVYTTATEFRRRLAAEYGAFNTSRGLPSRTPIDADERHRIRTDLATSMFVDEHGHAPLPHELSGWIARNDRDKTSTVAGYDITFSPVKSFSTLWAVADRDLRERMERAHDLAVADAIGWLEDNAAFTRTGTNGVAQVDIDGLITTAFTHRDARSGDPDLHTHLVISNKVRSVDGRWLALDGRPLHRAKVTISEVYNTALEAHARDLCGLEAEDLAPEEGKRAIREFVGVDRGLCELWSTRDREITQRFGQLAIDFQTAHGREPTPVEAQQLRQQANLETRQAKHEPRTAAEQFATWRQEARAHLGDDRAVADMIYLARHPGVARAGPEVGDPEWIAATARSIIDTVAASRATWQPHHVWAEARRAARSARVRVVDVDDVCRRLVDTALSPPLSVARGAGDEFPDEPELFRTHLDTSIYSDANTRQYTSWAVLDAERRLVECALQEGGRRAVKTAVEVAILEHAANNPGRELNTGQMMLVRDFALSGKRVQLALAPAGTGKTTAMAVLARAWEADGGHVLGLAPQGSAAGVLQADLGTDTATIDKLVHVLDRVENAPPGDPYFVPDWFARIDANSLVVIDEAGMAGTEILDRAVRCVLDRGGNVRLIGDDRQQGAVAAGGVIRDIAEAAGAVSLTAVMRFHDPAEGAATLALREGDPAGLGFYVDNGRIHEGEFAAVVDELYRDWSADIADGHDAIMLAGTRAVVNDLNARARADRLATLSDNSDPTETGLSDGNSASAGDIVITRRNDARYRISRTDHVRNGYRWTVGSVTADGGLWVTHKQSGRRTFLPADYVREHVELGYASTIRSSQGLTTDTARTLFTGIETRDAVYVPLSRGRAENHAYVVSALPGDEHSVLTDKARRPDTVIDILTAMLARDGVQKSATTIDRDAADPMQRLPIAAAAYTDAVGTAAEAVVGDEAMAAIDAAARVCSDGTSTFDLTETDAWPVLRKHLATIAVSGVDAVAALDTAARARELSTAGDPAAVLDWRLDPHGGHHAGTGPLPWLRAIPEALARSDYGPYLTARHELVDELAEHVRDLVTEWTPTEAPRWARPLMTDRRHATLLADLAVWRAANGVDDIDRRPTGPDRYAIKERRYQRRLDRRFARVVGDIDAPATRWAPIAEQVEPRLVTDPYWPIVAERLTLAHSAGADIDRLLHSAVDSDHPLPAEVPAAALWWRLARSEHLPAAALDPTGTSSRTLRPDWSPDVTRVFGPDLAAVIMADPSWPALVAAIESGDPHQWRPATLLDTAAELVRNAQEPDDVLRHDQYASALAWRVSAIVHHTSAALEDLPPEPVDPDMELATAAAAGVPDPDTIDTPPPGIDDDHLHSLLHSLVPPDAVVDEPPLEPEDVDTDGVPGHWHTTSTAAAGDVDAEQRYADLRAAFATADAEVARLRVALKTGAGEHSRAAAPVVSALRHRYDAQRPYAIAAADAHADFIAADADATDAADRHQHAQDLAAAARAAVDDAGADSIVEAAADRLNELTRDELAAYLDALELVQHLRTAQVAAHETGREADYLRALADDQRRAADDAHTALVDAAGGQDRIITNDYILDIAGIATDLDYTALREALTRRAALRDEWARAYIALSTNFLESTAPLAEESTRTDRTIATPPDVLAEPSSRSTATQDDAALAEVMRSDPIRLLRRVELDEQIRHLTAQAQRQNPTMSGWIQNRAVHEATETLARVEAEHEVLQRQTIAITAALGAASAAEQADRAHRLVVTELQRQRRELAATPALRAGRRRKLDTVIAGTEQRVAAAARQRAETTAEARQTAAAAEQLGAPKAQWENIARHAGHATARENEVASARAAVDQAHSAARAAADRLRDRSTEVERQLVAASAELERRQTLTAAKQAAEKWKRADRSGERRVIGIAPLESPPPGLEPDRQSSEIGQEPLQ